MATGCAEVNGVHLVAGDGAAIADAQRVVVAAVDESEVLLFDLP